MTVSTGQVKVLGETISSMLQQTGLASTTFHYLDRIPMKGNKSNRQKRCCVCKANGIRKDSRFYCAMCPENPGLCRGGDCFLRFHAWKGIAVGTDPQNWTLG
jgi:hypothetical protein